jgi:hypothetical protein
MFSGPPLAATAAGKTVISSPVVPLSVIAVSGPAAFRGTRAILRFVDDSGVKHTYIYMYVYIVLAQGNIHVSIQLLHSNQRMHPTLLKSQ